MRLILTGVGGHLSGWWTPVLVFLHPALRGRYSEHTALMAPAAITANQERRPRIPRGESGLEVTPSVQVDNNSIRAIRVLPLEELGKVGDLVPAGLPRVGDVVVVVHSNTTE